MPDTPAAPPAPAVPPAAGGARAVIEAIAGADDAAVLGIVLATEGSTYAKAGHLLLLSAHARTGWLSGGCLEPEVEAQAALARQSRRARRVVFATDSDGDLVFGTGVGCRGRVLLLLVPMVLLDGARAMFAALLEGGEPLALHAARDGALRIVRAEVEHAWTLPCDAADAGAFAGERWDVAVPPPPAAIVFGCGPESAALLPLLRGLGWIVHAVERRPRWVGFGTAADVCIEATPREAVARVPRGRYDAALLMSHNFELDREALVALAARDEAFVGLLGPIARREELLSLLDDDARASLRARLHSPVGIAIGGRGPEAIALSVAAALNAHRHGVAIASDAAA